MFKTSARCPWDRSDLYEAWTDPLLGELPGLLVLGVPQQLHDTLLVGSETSNLSDDVPDEDLLLAIVQENRGDRSDRSVLTWSRVCHMSAIWPTYVCFPLVLEGLEALGMTVVGLPVLAPYLMSKGARGENGRSAFLYDSCRFALILHLDASCVVHRRDRGYAFSLLYCVS